MFIGFLYELRSRKVPVGTQEAVALAQALKAGLHDSSLEGFYDVARALLIHDEKHLDAFDQAFARRAANGGGEAFFYGLPADHGFGHPFPAPLRQRVFAGHAQRLQPRNEFGVGAHIANNAAKFRWRIRQRALGFDDGARHQPDCS